jgi:predicted nucleic acid-binding protein
MTMPVVDSSVFVRMLTGDDPVKQAASEELFAQVAAGTMTVAVPVIVIAEVVFVLKSTKLYGFDRAQIAQALGTLVRQPHVHVEHESDVLRALDIFGSSGLGFGDALLVAAVERTAAPALYSYDQHFDRFATVNRLEP